MRVLASAHRRARAYSLFRPPRAIVRSAAVLTLVLLALPLVGARQSRAATHVVRMEANRFAPAELRVRGGDTVRFVNGQGGPHNVEFAAESIGTAARALLEGAMPGDKIAPLSGPLLLDEGETYSVVVPEALAEGRYVFVCLPHQAFMRGALTVVR